MKVSWTILKDFFTTRYVPLNYVEFESYYWLKADDINFSLECELDKNQSDTTDLDDFEDNYKSSANIKRNDGDGDALARFKIAPTGWIYQAFCFEFEIGKYNSLYCKDVSGSNISGITYKIYDGSNVEITNSGSEGNAVKTVVTFEPAWDYCIVSGRIDQLSIATSDIRMWTIGVPDIPEAYGGSKTFVNGLNLKFVDDLVTEGRAPKRLNYSATYHTNKLQFTFKHDTSTAHRCMVIIDLYKA